MTRADAAQKRELYCELLDHYGPALSGRCKDVLELYYEEDLSLSEIAENCGITRQGVHDMIRRCGKILEGYEERLGLVSRFLRVKKKTEEIRGLTGDERVARLADEILEDL